MGCTHANFTYGIQEEGYKSACEQNLATSALGLNQNRIQCKTLDKLCTADAEAMEVCYGRFSFTGLTCWLI